MKSKFDLARYGVQIRDLKSSHSFFLSENYVNSDIVIISTRFDDNDTDILEDVLIRIDLDGKIPIVVKNIFEFPEYSGASMTLFDKIVYESWVDRISDSDYISTLSDREYFKHYDSGVTRASSISANLEIERISSRYSSIVVLDRMDYVCENELKKCFSSDSELNKFFYDYAHHTLEGAKFFSTRVDQVNWIPSFLF